MTDLLRARRSTRHFSATPLEEARVRALIEAASWAPSGGNEQAWAVTALTPATTRALLDRIERRGWNALLPKLMGMVRRAVGPVDDAQAILLARAKAEGEGIVRGAPWLLVVRAPRPTRADLAPLHAALTALLPPDERPSLELMERTNGEVNEGVVRASALCFAYALTLAATAEGLASCLQHMPLGFEPLLRAELAIPEGDELVSTVLVGHDDPTDEVNARARREAKRRPVAIDVR